jgi:CDGSH-type Zn-finger protein
VEGFDKTLVILSTILAEFSSYLSALLKGWSKAGNIVHFRENWIGARLTDMSETPTIKPTENGPYLVSGCSDLKSYAGDKTFASDGTVALCRCGQSKNKPFCSGAHWHHQFDENAPPRT